MSEKMMEVTFTCPECASAISVYPDTEATKAQCSICQHEIETKFTQKHVEGVLETCPCCERKDFYKQKDFNRMIGVGLFIVAAILSIWTYGISFIVLWLFDLMLFRKLNMVTICYKCNTIFRNLSNINNIHEFNHEMNDRIIYSDHDFDGKQLEHH